MNISNNKIMTIQQLQLLIERYKSERMINRAMKNGLIHTEASCKGNSEPRRNPLQRSVNKMCQITILAYKMIYLYFFLSLQT